MNVCYLDHCTAFHFIITIYVILPAHMFRQCIVAGVCQHTYRGLFLWIEARQHTLSMYFKRNWSLPEHMNLPPAHILRAFTLNSSPSAHTIEYFKRNWFTPPHMNIPPAHIIMKHSEKDILPVHLFLCPPGSVSRQHTWSWLSDGLNRPEHIFSFTWARIPPAHISASKKKKIVCQLKSLGFCTVNVRPPY